jgi:hypothetical protein
MAKMKRTTSKKNQPSIVPHNPSTALFDIVFAPLPENVEAQIRALLPTPEPVDEDNPLAVLQNFKPEGWTPFAELMWNWGNRDREVSEPADSFTQAEVDKRISYLDDGFSA